MKNKPKIYYLEWEPALYASKTSHLTDVEDLLYRRLTDAWWMRKGLPNNNQRLALIARYPQDKFDDAWVEVSKFFYPKGDNNELLGHEKLEECLSNCLGKSKSSSKAGKASAESRRKKSLDCVDDVVERAFNGCSTDVQRSLNHTDTDTDTDRVVREIGGMGEREIEPKNGEDILGAPPKTPPSTKTRKRKKPKTPDWTKVENLNQEAWDLYLSYRKEVLGKPPYRVATRAEMLAEYPQDVQMEAVLMTCETAGDWTGIFPDRIFNLETGKRR